MKKFLILGLLMLPILGQAQVNINLEKDMEFMNVTPCLGNSSLCAPFILGQGKFVKDTPKRLEVFLKLKENRLLRKIAFDSMGGNFESALDLGVFLNKKNMEVFLPKNVYEEEKFKPNSFNTEIRQLSNVPQCKNECGYAFLGGVLRNIEEGKNFSIKPLKLTNKSNEDRYSENEIISILDSFKITSLLMRDIKESKSILIYSNSNITKLNIENYTKKEFNWVYQKKDGIVIGLKSILLSEGRGRLVLALKKDFSKKINEQYSLEIMFKPVFENRDYLNALDGISISKSNSENPIEILDAKWKETNGVISTVIQLKKIDELRSENELDLKVDLPNAYYTYRLDTGFYTDNIFNKLDEL